MKIFDFLENWNLPIDVGCCCWRLHYVFKLQLSDIRCQKMWQDQNNFSVAKRGPNYSTTSPEWRKFVNDNIMSLARRMVKNILVSRHQKIVEYALFEKYFGLGAPDWHRTLVTWKLCLFSIVSSEPTLSFYSFHFTQPWCTQDMLKTHFFVSENLFHNICCTTQICPKSH